MIAIPAIDLLDNQVVRLFKGDFNLQTNYALDPIVYAQAIASSGLTHLHLVDLSGAKSGNLAHTSLMQKIVSKTALKVDFGGGIKTKEDVELLLENGANQVVIGSLCVTETALVQSWIEQFGVERFVLALDTDGKQLKIKGWQEGSGVSIQQLMSVFEQYEDLTILTTDIRRDGTGMGTSTDLYESLINQFSKQRWIASGGVESMNDLAILRETGCFACVVGKAILDGKISLEALNQFNQQANGSL